MEASNSERNSNRFEKEIEEENVPPTRSVARRVFGTPIAIRQKFLRISSAVLRVRATPTDTEKIEIGVQE